MTVELTVPDLGESIRDVRIAQWLKQEGDWVKKDENLVDIESEKATVTIPAPEAGKLAQIVVATGAEAQVGQVIARIEPQAAAAVDARPKDAAAAPSAPAAATAAAKRESDKAPAAGPDARRALREFGLTSGEISVGGDGVERLTREDIERYAADHQKPGESAPAAAEPAKETLANEAPAKEPKPGTAAPAAVNPARPEEIIPMSPLRRRIAERLVAAQRDAALLTTFNEVDMSAIMALRKKHGERFLQVHQVKLGLTGFFVKAAVEALRQYPALNAEVRGNNIVQKKFYDIGVAVGTPHGLVVPVVRAADTLGLSQIERQIADMARRAREGKIMPQELAGGTFTITNGGVFGSLLSTPIVSPPQTGILGLHTIQDRPVAIDGAVVIRPMMYVALTYDHRVVDGEQAVTFLRRIKERIEDPALMLIDV